MMLGLTLSLKKLSFENVQPADAEKNLPQRLSFESLEESNASARKLA
jgi:hypothetical protein